MEITEDEAKRVADGIARVEKYYPKVSAVISGKIADHIALGAALISVYGPRITAMKIRKAGDNAQPINPQTENVYPFGAGKP